MGRFGDACDRRADCHGRAVGEGRRAEATAATGTLASGSWVIIVLDTGGVEGLAPIDERRRARLRVLREHAADIVVPAAVLAESVFSGHVGRDHHVRGLLETVDVIDVDEDTGYAAGALRKEAIEGGVDPPPSGVDAIVAAMADVRARADDVLIVTSDHDDLELLAASAENARRLTILRA